MFTLIAIPFLRPVRDGWPDPTAMSVLLLAATLYLTMRMRSSDVKGPGLSIYALWGMAVSVGLGIFGGWVFWAVKPA